MLLAGIVAGTIAWTESCAGLPYDLYSPHEQQSGRFGWCITPVGNPATGAVDMVVGAPNEECQGAAEGGRAYRFLTADGVLQSEIGSVTPQVRGHFGFSVASIGDVDGDGEGDLAVGAPGENFGACPNAGSVHLISGAWGTEIRSLVSPKAEPAGYFGWSVLALGDIDGDGIGDLAVGAPGEVPPSLRCNVGRAYLFDGDTGRCLGELDAPVVLPDGRFGGVMAALRGSGRPPVIAFGMPTAGDSGSGAVYLMDTAGQVLHSLLPLESARNARFGSALASSDDIDGDEIMDVLIGAPLAGERGLAFAFSGASGSPLTQFSPPPQAGGFFGRSVAFAGDIDGDGAFEVAIGCLVDRPGEGWRGCLCLARADGQEVGFLSAPDQPGSSFGWAVAALGDLDGDARGDLAVGAYGAEGSAGLYEAGCVSVIRPHAASGEPALPGLVIVGPWPNPARDAIRVAVSGGGRGTVRVAVLDAAGRIQPLRAYPVFGGEAYEIRLCPSLPSGVYWLRATSGGYAATKILTVIR